MTRDETKKILMAIQSVFPNFHIENKTFTLDTWNMILHDFRYSDVEMALIAYVRTETSGFAPSPGQLIEKINLITRPKELNEQEAYSIVQQAINRSGLNYMEEFEKLPYLIQKAVGRPSQLRDWALEENPNHEVRASNFMRNYRTEMERQKEIQKLPDGIKELIRQVNKNSESERLEGVNKRMIYKSKEDQKVVNFLETSVDKMRMPEKLRKKLEELRNG